MPSFPGGRFAGVGRMNIMSTNESLVNESLQHLQGIVLKLDSVLNPSGVVFELEGSGFSSLGVFAAGYTNVCLYGQV